MGDDTLPYRYLADCHSHSDCSFDGTEDMSRMCARAEALGLAYYAVTDHCECDQYEGSEQFGGRKYYDVVRRAYRELEENQARFPRLRLLKGIELGQPLQNLPAALDALDGRQYDFVIGSLHDFSVMPSIPALSATESISFFLASMANFFIAFLFMYYFLPLE